MSFAVPQILQPHSMLAVGLGGAARARPTTLPAPEVDLRAVQANLFYLDEMNSLIRETALLGGGKIHAQDGAVRLLSALGPLTIELLTGPLLHASEPHIDPRTIPVPRGHTPSPFQHRVSELCSLALAILFRRQHRGAVLGAVCGASSLS
jgi:hypothetical protein